MSLWQQIFGDPVFVGMWIFTICLIPVIIFFSKRANKSLDRDLKKQEILIESIDKSQLSSNLFLVTRHVFKNRNEILKSNLCGCYYCGTQFRPLAVVNWVDKDQTATCPNCNIDSVIGDASGLPITTEFLQAAYKFWFEENHTTPRLKNERRNPV